ncbi:V-type ATP synthase subunit D, partial [Streptomyces sp. NPDC006265]|uniref:V-type ATP synthase subunit D n=1 Tax=Streptomyces sp. NPDC006265 TaxID=3156740 RepID=UPI0033A35841
PAVTYASTAPLPGDIDEYLGAEVSSTRHRVRALRRHWIPRLREALDRSDLALEQAEHEDSVRRRWAARRRS